MSASKKVRIVRGAPPNKPIKRTRYRKVIAELLRDTGGRCAYSMQHQERAGAMEVDHIDPRRKKDVIQQFKNLAAASRHCNGKKGDNWPTRAERAAGCRFLNPYEEMDYGEQIFEDPQTHFLIGITPAAKWHIRICGLNADHLVSERAKRAKYVRQLKEIPVLGLKGNPDDVAKMIQSFREEVELMIPEIPSPVLM